MQGDLSNEELNSIGDAIRFARAQLVARNKSVLSIGSKVKFTSSTRGTISGVVKKINRKFILVDTQNPGSFTSGVWKVPANMLEVM
jgi:transcription elongation factor